MEGLRQDHPANKIMRRPVNAKAPFIGNKGQGIVGMNNENIILSNNTISVNLFIGINLMGKMLKKSPPPLILTITGAIVMIVPEAVQYTSARKIGIHAEYRMWRGGSLVILLTTLIFGKVFGQPVRAEIRQEETYKKKKLALLMLTGPLANMLLSAGFLPLYLMKGTFASLAIMRLEMSLLTALSHLCPSHQ